MSHNIVPFEFQGVSLTVIADDNGDPEFEVNSLCALLGYANPRDAIGRHVKAEDVVKRDTLTAGGKQRKNFLKERGMWRLVMKSEAPNADAVQDWIAGDVLPSIRKTGSYAAPAAVVPAPTIEAFKLAPLVVRAARALGLDKNAAAISANQAVTRLTGTNVLKLLGHQHLEAENQTAMYFTPTELGDRLGISGRKFNMLLAEAGLQAKKGEHWVPLTTAEGFCRIMDTGKRHGDGTMIQQIKWAENVLALIEKAAA